MLFELFQFSSDPVSDGAKVMLHGSHDLALVALSYLIAVAAAYSALDLASHAGQVRAPRVAWLWRCVGAFCLGGGIWSMHFVAMQAFQVPLRIEYDVGLTLFSLLIAVAASLLTMWVIGRARMQLGLYFVAALSSGLGIAAMHYTGMLAIESDARVYYDAPLFIASILIAVAASFVALVLAFFFHDKKGASFLWLKLFAALVMGVAICAMHFVGMAGYQMVLPPGVEPHLLHDNQHSPLAFAIAGVMLAIIVSGMIGSWAEQTRRRSESEVHELSRRLDEMSHYDSLTGLFSRPAMAEMFSTLVTGPAQNHQLGLMYLDVDKFRRINESFGYAAADQVLTLVAERIRRATRANDIVGRINGDEFCIMAMVNDEQELIAYAERVMGRMHRPMTFGEHEFQLSVAVGMSLYPAHGTHFDDLISNAVLALTDAKRQPLSRAHVFAEEMRARARQQRQIERDLRVALKRDQLVVHYQPIIEAGSGRISSLEALVRWQHPTLGFIPPDQFIGIAEAISVITELDLWVMRRACRDLRGLHQAGYPDLHVSVNCSAVNLTLTRLPEMVAQILAETGVDARFVVLEVTENALMENLTMAASILDQIRALGVRISIDDFGSGYSSLAYLSRLPLDTLKVDRMFIKDIPQSLGNSAITSAILAMAHKLQLKVVAEGVETQEHRDFLQQNSCDYLQGYLISRPVPVANLHPLLQSHNGPHTKAGGRVVGQ